MDLKLKGKAIVVTGGTRNLGRAIVLALLEEGARVVTTYREDEAAAKEFLSMVPAHHLASIRVHALDVSSDEACGQLAQAAVQEFSGLDVLVNNAAVFLSQTPEDISDRDFDWMLHNTLRSTVYMTRAAFKIMKGAGGGRIVNMSTAGVYTANPRELLYLSAKAGVEAATRAFARYGAQYRISVNAVAAHVISSGMGQETLSQDTSIIDRIPLHRAGRIDELVALVLYLSSPVSEYMTGQVLHLNGGRLMR